MFLVATLHTCMRCERFLPLHGLPFHTFDLVLCCIVEYIKFKSSEILFIFIIIPSYCRIQDVCLSEVLTSVVAKLVSLPSLG